jgi:hypothetical protein
LRPADGVFVAIKSKGDLLMVGSLKADKLSIINWEQPHFVKKNKRVGLKKMFEGLIVL